MICDKCNVSFSKVISVGPSETFSLLVKAELAWVEIMFALDLDENELCSYAGPQGP